ncbi:hypothetical protein V8F20_009860, partial [Naviculisporaceae sp. PSN 640]
CPWNSNMMVVPDSITDQYSYIISFQNVATETYQVNCFNILSPDGTLTGSFEGSEPPVEFTMSPGEITLLAVKATTRAACAWAPGTSDFPTTSHGQYAGVWAEFEFESAGNSGWSGADCSSLVAGNAGLDVPGCQVSLGGVSSTIWPGGTMWDNAYVPGSEDEDGLGLNISPGDVTIEAKIGFS